MAVMYSIVIMYMQDFQIITQRSNHIFRAIACKNAVANIKAGGKAVPSHHIHISLHVFSGAAAGGMDNMFRIPIPHIFNGDFYAVLLCKGAELAVIFPVDYLSFLLLAVVKTLGWNHRMDDHIGGAQ